jgi:hypothetical protein
MSKKRTLLTFVPLLAVLIFVAFSARSAETTFDGEIADSQCAMGVHSLNRSHKEMIEMGHAGSTAEDCTRYCVHSRGGRYVLLTKHDVFKLDNQELAERYAGQKVRLTGALDPESHVIQIKTIEPLKAK